ncbi:MULTISPECIES: hypothetical protein [Thermomonosporaceae]|uniref:hypothetical protein n=1 Tax=Thermomonosporaceae TaxID=2012 RepID=UPI00255AE1C9|nr:MULTISPECIES: hypothetical protein [Thermomonosporaceae]MDL4774979.1 hypothetical protein [Actinomadura xylanilytica]
MGRLESAAWPLAGGVLCVFILAIVLKTAAWPVGFALVAASVAGWSLLAPPAAGAAVGVAGWAFVTGFDVNKTGELTLAGGGDLARVGLLVGLGLVAGAAGRLLAGRGRWAGDSDPDLWPAGHAPDREPTGRVPDPWAGGASPHQPVPRQYGAGQEHRRTVPVPGDSTKESKHA